MNDPIKRYIVNIDQEEYIVEIQGERILINGIPAEDSFFSALNDQGLYLIQAGMEKQEIHIQRETQTDFRITVDGHHLTAQIERDNGRKNRKRKKTAKNDGQVNAPMAGLILEISVAEGDFVKEDQPLLVLEAMKMQMKIKSPSNGKIQKIYQKSSGRVEKGDLILKIDQSSI